MLYRLLKIASRLAIRIYCRKIVITNPETLKIRGPVLLAANHPNSFLDSVILDTLFQQPVWSLARGDAFKNKFIARILHSLKILPVYRTSEGVENLSENYKTFDACLALFREKGIVTIFSEGKCINEWHLRPLKKGTARLALRAWEDGIPLTVIPVAINYSSFTRFGKNIFLRFGEPITRNRVNHAEAEGLRHQAFNQLLRTELEKGVLEISKDDRAAQREKLSVKIPAWKKILLALPAAAGWLAHLPLYVPVRHFIRKRTLSNDHYDSVMYGVLMLLYPLYLAVSAILVSFILPSPLYAAFTATLPLLAWCRVQIKKQTD